MRLINIFKGSLIITITINIVKAFMTSYKNSRLKKGVTAVGVCFKSSKTFGVLSRYANKKPYYRNSLIYRLIMAIAGLFDRLFGFINKIGAALLGGSSVSKEVYSAIKADANTKLCGFGLLFMSIPVGTLVALIISGNVSAVNMIICWVVFIIGLLFVLIASCESAIKSSFIIKVFAGFFDLIR